MIIAVIDDGIAKKYLQNSLLQSVVVRADLTIEEDDSIVDNLNHATICALIINKYDPQSQFVSINIFDYQSSHRSSVEKLIAGIVWACSNGIKIIHLSLGTIHFKDKHMIRKCINHYAALNHIFVSSVSNDNRITFPASFSNVINVCRLQKRKPYSYNMYIYNEAFNCQNIDFIAESEHNLELCTGETMVTKQCNSYATPFITAKVGSVLTDSSTDSVDQVIAALCAQSDKIRKILPKRLYKVDWMVQAVYITCDDLKLENTFYKLMLLKELPMWDHYEFDTVIFESNKKQKVEMIDEINLLIKYNVNIVYLNQYADAYPVFQSYQYSYDKKIYCTPILHPYITTCRNVPTAIEEPIVYLQFNSGDTMLLVIPQLLKDIQNKGYNCMHISNYYRAILYDIEYIPPIHFKEDVNQVVNYLLELNEIGFYDLDIIYSMEYHEWAKQCDIYIKVKTGKKDKYLTIEYKGDEIEIAYEKLSCYILDILKH